VQREVAAERLDPVGELDETCAAADVDATASVVADSNTIRCPC
jgi:hypothetical protein